jgi:hypothetical protein
LREDWTAASKERKKRVGKRERKKKEENQQGKRKYSVKPSSNLVRFKRYGS